jgi:hypothetical protein
VFTSSERFEQCKNVKTPLELKLINIKTHTTLVHSNRCTYVQIRRDLQLHLHEILTSVFSSKAPVCLTLPQFIIYKYKFELPRFDFKAHSAYSQTARTNISSARTNQTKNIIVIFGFCCTHTYYILQYCPFKKV